MAPTWPPRWSPNRTKVDEKWSRKSIKFSVPLGIDLFFDFDGFSMENEAKLVPKSDQKSISTSEGRFCKKPYKTNGFLMIFWFSGTEVGTKNRSKIDQKLKPKMDCLLASIFGGFWCQLGSILAPQIDQNSPKIRSQKAQKN